ncbi:MAG: isoamylase early set domain-containing protein [Desulfobulbaceae bacterium]|nr:isoamylase early set domain-containing protein [Desulfobulbaceae bacterium]
MACGTKKCATSKTKTKKTTPTTEFTITAPDAKEVFLVGEFNDWCGDDLRMRRFKGGVFKKSVKLSPGRYEYRFVVDGEWWTDPANPNRSPNSFGSENSVLTIS